MSNIKLIFFNQLSTHLSSYYPQLYTNQQNNDDYSKLDYVQIQRLVSASNRTPHILQGQLLDKQLATDIINLSIRWDISGEFLYSPILLASSSIGRALGC